MESLEFFHKQRSNKNERKNDMRVYASIIEFSHFSTYNTTGKVHILCQYQYGYDMSFAPNTHTN